MRALPRFSRSLSASAMAAAVFLLGCSSSHSRNPYGGRGGFQSFGSSYGSGFGQSLMMSGAVGAISVPYAVAFFVIGALLGAFFSQRLKKWRKWILAIVFAIAGVVFLFQGAPLAYGGWLVLGFVIAWMLLRVAAALAKRSTLFGSAEWANRQHIEAGNLTQDRGLMLGTFNDKDGDLNLTYSGDRHLLTIAPTRAGKGVAAIIPNLLTYTGSAIVIDPKGENAQTTARQRRKLGQAVYVVDPWQITGEPVARFNPLEWLQYSDPEDVGENAFMLAEALIVRKQGGDDRFWDDEAAALLWGLILYVATHPGAVDRTLGGVRDIITSGPNTLNAVLQAMAESGDLIMESTAARTLAKDEKLKANVFTTLQAHTHFLDSPRMRDSLSESDFRFEDLKAGKATVFLVLPADRLAPFGRWLRLLIQQAITVNARNIAEKPDKPILFLLDEMAALDRLQKVEEAYGLMAGFGMQLWGIAQDCSQLKRIYGDGWETFVANAGVIQYFGSRDERTASYFSKLCGVGTEEKISITTSTTRSSQGSSYGTSTAKDHVQRQLAFPDELMRLTKGTEILLVENNNPILAKRLEWFSDPRLKELGVHLNRAALPPLTQPPSSSSVS